MRTHRVPAVLLLGVTFSCQSRPDAIPDAIASGPPSMHELAAATYRGLEAQDPVTLIDGGWV